MAATNYTPIQLYYSTTASAAPTAGNLVNGELAINITDGKLYYKDNGGVVQVIATKGAGTIGGSNTQIQFNDGGALAGNAAMVFNKATNVTTLTTLNLTNALGAAYGGTAQSAYAQGDLLYASAVNTLSKLSIGTVNYILTSTGSVPQWVAPTSVTVQTANNLAGGAAGSVPYQSAADTTAFLAIGAANRVMTSTGSAPQWVTSLTGLTGVSSSSITNTGLTSGRVVYSGASGVQTDSANLTFNGTTLSAGGFSTTGNSTLVKLVTIGDSGFTTGAVLAAATPAKLYIGTGAVTDGTSAGGATNTLGTITAFGQTQVIATNANVTYTNLATLYIAGAPTAGTNVTITNPYSLYIAGGASYLGGSLLLNTLTASKPVFTDANKNLTSSGILLTDQGGTGLSSFTAGDLVYYATGTAFTKLGIGTNGQILTSTGTAPQWSTLSGVAVTTFSAGTTGFTPSSATSGAITLAGTLATTNGGTGLTSFTANRVFYASSTSAVGQSANLTFDGTTLTAANFADSSLTSGRVTYAGASGNLTDSGNLLFSGQELSVQNSAAATGPINPSYAISAVGGNNLILNLSANGEAYTLNTASAKYQYYQAGTVISVGTSYVSGTGSAALIDFNAYNSGGSATDLYLGAVSGPNANGAAIFVLGRRTGATSWAESLRIDENGGLSTTPAANGNTVFNENGVDSDFRVESVGNTNMLFVDASASRVGIGVASPAYPLDVNGTVNSTQGFTIGGDKYIYQGNQYTGSLAAADIVIAPATSGKFVVWASGTGQVLNANATGELVINEGGFDYDFRVESDTNTHALFVDAGNSRVGIGTSGPDSLFDVNGIATFGGTSAISTNGKGKISYFADDGGGDNTAYGNNVVLNTVAYTNTLNIVNTNHSGTAWVMGSLSAAYPNSVITRLVAVEAGGTNRDLIYATPQLVKLYSSNAERFSVAGSEVVVNDISADVDFRVESDGSTHMLFVDAGNNRVGINDNTPQRTFSVQGGTDLIQAGNNTTGGTLRLSSNMTDSSVQYGVITQRQYALTAEPEGYTLVAGTCTSTINYLSLGGGIDEQNMATQVRIFVGPNVSTRSAGVDYMAQYMDATQIVFNEGGYDQDFRVESDANTHMLFVDAGNNGVNIGNNSAVPPISGLRVAGATNPAGGIVSTNLIAGFVASNYSGTRYWVLHVMAIGATKQATAFNCMGDVHASSYTTWNLSNLYIRREYDSYNVFGSITGVIKSAVTVSIVDISYNSNRYVAIKFAGGDPGIEANLVGYLMDQQYTNGTDAFFINGTAGVTENAVIATY